MDAKFSQKFNDETTAENSSNSETVDRITPDISDKIKESVNQADVRRLDACENLQNVSCRTDFGNTLDSSPRKPITESSTDSTSIHNAINNDDNISDLEPSANTTFTTEVTYEMPVIIYEETIITYFPVCRKCTGTSTDTSDKSADKAENAPVRYDYMNACVACRNANGPATQTNTPNAAHRYILVDGTKHPSNDTRSSPNEGDIGDTSSIGDHSVAFKMTESDNYMQPEVLPSRHLAANGESSITNRPNCLQIRGDARVNMKSKEDRGVFCDKHIGTRVEMGEATDSKQKNEKTFMDRTEPKHANSLNVRRLPAYRRPGKPSYTGYRSTEHVEEKIEGRPVDRCIPKSAAHLQQRVRKSTNSNLPPNTEINYQKTDDALAAEQILTDRVTLATENGYAPRAEFLNGSEMYPRKSNCSLLHRGIQNQDSEEKQQNRNNRGGRGTMFDREMLPDYGCSLPMIDDVITTEEQTSNVPYHFASLQNLNSIEHIDTGPEWKSDSLFQDEENISKIENEYIQTSNRITASTPRRSNRIKHDLDKSDEENDDCFKYLSDDSSCDEDLAKRAQLRKHKQQSEERQKTVNKGLKSAKAWTTTPQRAEPDLFSISTDEEADYVEVDIPYREELHGTTRDAYHQKRDIYHEEKDLASRELDSMELQCQEKFSVENNRVDRRVIIPSSDRIMVETANNGGTIDSLIVNLNNEQYTGMPNSSEFTHLRSSLENSERNNIKPCENIITLENGGQNENVNDTSNLTFMWQQKNDKAFDKRDSHLTDLPNSLQSYCETDKTTDLNVKDTVKVTKCMQPQEPPFDCLEGQSDKQHHSNHDENISCQEDLLSEKLQSDKICGKLSENFTKLHKDQQQYLAITNLEVHTSHALLLTDVASTSNNSDVQDMSNSDFNEANDEERLEKTKDMEIRLKNRCEIDSDYLETKTGGIHLTIEDKIVLTSSTGNSISDTATGVKTKEEMQVMDEQGVTDERSNCRNKTSKKKRKKDKKLLEQESTKEIIQHTNYEGNNVKEEENQFKSFSLKGTTVKEEQYSNVCISSDLESFSNHDGNTDKYPEVRFPVSEIEDTVVQDKDARNLDLTDRNAVVIKEYDNANENGVCDNDNETRKDCQENSDKEYQDKIRTPKNKHKQGSKNKKKEEIKSSEIGENTNLAKNKEPSKYQNKKYEGEAEHAKMLPDNISVNCKPKVMSISIETDTLEATGKILNEITEAPFQQTDDNGRYGENHKTDDKNIKEALIKQVLNFNNEKETTTDDISHDQQQKQDEIKEKMEAEQQPDSDKQTKETKKLKKTKGKPTQEGLQIKTAQDNKGIINTKGKSHSGVTKNIHTDKEQNKETTKRITEQETVANESQNSSNQKRNYFGKEENNTNVQVQENGKYNMEINEEIGIISGEKHNYVTGTMLDTTDTATEFCISKHVQDEMITDRTKQTPNKKDTNTDFFHIINESRDHNFTLQEQEKIQENETVHSLINTPHDKQAITECVLQKDNQENLKEEIQTEPTKSTRAKKNKKKKNKANDVTLSSSSNTTIIALTADNSQQKKEDQNQDKKQETDADDKNCNQTTIENKLQTNDNEISNIHQKSQDDTEDIAKITEHGEIKHDKDSVITQEASKKKINQDIEEKTPGDLTYSTETAISTLRSQPIHEIELDENKSPNKSEKSPEESHSIKSKQPNIDEKKKTTVESYEVKNKDSTEENGNNTRSTENLESNMIFDGTGSQSCEIDIQTIHENMENIALHQIEKDERTEDESTTGSNHREPGKNDKSMEIDQILNEIWVHSVTMQQEKIQADEMADLFLNTPHGTPTTTECVLQREETPNEERQTKPSISTKAKKNKKKKHKVNDDTISPPNNTPIAASNADIFRQNENGAKKQETKEDKNCTQMAVNNKIKARDDYIQEQVFDLVFDEKSDKEQEIKHKEVDQSEGITADKRKIDVEIDKEKGDFRYATETVNLSLTSDQMHELELTDGNYIKDGRGQVTDKWSDYNQMECSNKEDKSGVKGTESKLNGERVIKCIDVDEKSCLMPETIKVDLSVNFTSTSNLQTSVTIDDANHHENEESNQNRELNTCHKTPFKIKGSNDCTTTNTTRLIKTLRGSSNGKEEAMFIRKEFPQNINGKNNSRKAENKELKCMQHSALEFKVPINEHTKVKDLIKEESNTNENSMSKNVIKVTTIHSEDSWTTKKNRFQEPIAMADVSGITKEEPELKNKANSVSQNFNENSCIEKENKVIGPNQHDETKPVFKGISKTCTTSNHQKIKEILTTETAQKKISSPAGKLQALTESSHAKKSYETDIHHNKENENNKAEATADESLIEIKKAEKKHTSYNNENKDPKVQLKQRHNKTKIDSYKLQKDKTAQTELKSELLNESARSSKSCNRCLKLLLLLLLSMIAILVLSNTLISPTLDYPDSSPPV